MFVMYLLATNIQRYVIEIASVSGFFCCYENTELKEEGPVPL